MKKLIDKIIPPNEYKFRNGFTNHYIINSLDNDEKVEIEKELLELLKKKLNEDLLIIETLSYLKSRDSLYLLSNIQKIEDNPLNKIILSNCIYAINGDTNMIDDSYEAFQKINNDYEKITAFYYLKQFNVEKTNDIIKKYFTNENYLLAYNARLVLEESI